MPRRRKKQAHSISAVITLAWQALVAVVSAITLATMAYYRWASKIVNPRWRRTAYLSPVVLLIIGSLIGLLSSPAPEPESAYVYSSEPTEVIEADSVNDGEAPEVEPEPQVETEKLEPREPEPYVEPEAEAYVEPEPVNTGIAYIAGNCPDLKAQGLGPFYRGDANYTLQRDGDKDGIACE